MTTAVATVKTHTPGGGRGLPMDGVVPMATADSPGSVLKAVTLTLCVCVCVCVCLCVHACVRMHSHAVCLIKKLQCCN